MLHTVNVEGIEALGHCILAVVVPPTYDTDRPAPFPATLPTLTVPAVRAPCRAFPLRSVNLEFVVSHASADVARYAGFAARIAASGSAPAVYEPAAHTHAAAELAPAAEVVPAGQLVHTAEELAPVTAEYVPAGQFSHVVVPNWPAGHVCACKRDRPDKFCEQFSTEIDPISEDDPAGHCTHAPPFGP